MTRIKSALFTALFAFSALTSAERAAAQAPAAPDEFSKQMDAYLEKDENLEKLGTALRKFFMKKEQEARAAMEKAEKDKVEEQFKNPVDVPIGESPVRGDPNAPVTIVEFSEFQCPYCKRGAATAEEVLKTYPGKVKLTFKHYPLPFHPQAQPAAAASVAAGKQGKFWEMHDRLFANQQNLGDELYMNLARELGLDMDRFAADLKDPRTIAIVEQDRALGEKLGIRGTPGFFINGVLLSGAQPAQAFKPIIDRWLEQSK